MNSIIRRAGAMTRIVVLWLVVVSVIAAVSACGGGAGEASSATPLLAGNGSDRALAALPSVSPTRAATEDIENGVLLSRISVVLKLDATVADVNAAAQTAGATAFAFARANSPFLTLTVPRQTNAAALEQLAARLNGLAGIVFADAARLAQQLELPNTGQATALVEELDYLLATRFPAAWNARGLAENGCASRKVTVIVPDFYFGLPGNFLDQMQGSIVSPVLPSEPLSTETPNAHGYEVVGVLTAKFDAVLAHGANPLPACLRVHIVDAHDIDFFALIDRLVEAIQAETGPVIVSSSFGYVYDKAFCPQACKLSDITPAFAAALRISVERHFLEGIMWASFAMQPGIADRVLLVQAAGNDADSVPGSLYAGLRSARLGSPIAIAAVLDELDSVLGDSALWTAADPALPALTLDAATIATLKLLRDGVVPLAGTTDRNLVLVGSTTNKPLLADLTVSAFSDNGAALFAVGELVSTIDFQLLQGTSFAAPQVAGLASYLWLLDADLRSQPVAETLKLIRATSRSNGLVGGVIDAYGAVLALDSRQGSTRRIRRALVDVNNDGNFDHLDLLQFQAAYGLTDPSRPSIPSTRDYSRFDLNGDGFTGGIITDRFDLDASGIDAGSAANSVTLSIEGYQVTMNEAALSDIQILCFYAYSPLYATSPVNRDEALLERTRMLGPDQCVGARLEVSLPAQISTSASLNATIQVPIGNGQFGPGANLLVDFTPSSATVSPTSGRTDANGAIATTVTPNAGSTSVSVMVVARADAGTTALAQKTVSATVQAAVYVGSLVESINQPGFTQCDSLNFCITNSASGGDEYSNLRFVLQANGTFVASGTIAHAVRGDTTTTDGCHSTITETGTGTVTAFDGSISRPKGSIRGIGTTTRTTSEIACRGNPAFSNTSTKTTTFTASSNFLTPVFSGGTLVQLIWNGSSTDQTNTTFMQQGEVHLVP